MKFRKFLAAMGFMAATVVPAASMATPVHAVALNQVPLRCRVQDVEFINLTSEGCDLAVDKQVSINGGSYVEADTSGDAAMATVGDTVTYKITVTNTSSDPTTMTPYGNVTVHDLLPTGVTFGSASASVGTYSESTGDWVFSLSGDGSNLPATLTITTTITVTGLVQNTAAFSDYDPCVDGCLGNVGYYQDDNSSNNSNDAWVDPQVKPQVLGATTTNTPSTPAPTLANTGTGIATPTIVAVSLISATITLGYVSRRKMLSDQK